MNAFARAVREGLASRPKSIPPRFFYDERGSELFDRICDLPEYYLSRTELSILERIRLPSFETVIEFGGGSGLKTRRILESVRPRRLVSVDISSAALQASMSRVSGFEQSTLAMEYGDAMGVLPEGGLVLFLGSNIGNMDRTEAVRFLSALRGRHILVGFDLEKDPAILHAAYNDRAGITAEFNRNLLVRINRDLGGRFDPAKFDHQARYVDSRIEMRLASRGAQQVIIESLDQVACFEDGETIHTENSHKFTRARIESLASGSGFDVRDYWTDERGWFADVLLSPRD